MYITNNSLFAAAIKNCNVNVDIKLYTAGDRHLNSRCLCCLCCFSHAVHVPTVVIIMTHPVPSHITRLPMCIRMSSSNIQICLHCWKCTFEGGLPHQIFTAWIPWGLVYNKDYHHLRHSSCPYMQQFKTTLDLLLNCFASQFKWRPCYSVLLRNLSAYAPWNVCHTCFFLLSNIRAFFNNNKNIHRSIDLNQN